MTPLASATRTAPRSHSIWQSARALGLACLAMLAAQTIAGYFFLWSIDIVPRQVTPLTTIRYLYHYGEREDVRQRVLVCSAIGFGTVVAGAVAAFLPRARPLHGAARFEGRPEIAKAGLLGDEGILLGESGRRYLILPGQQGIAIAARPRSGKGASVVVPNALNWPGSLLGLDIKRENWTITAGYRAARGQDCFLFEPLNEFGETAHWNPFSYVSDRHAQRINDLQRIAVMLYPEVPGTDPFWIASARSLFLGLSLYLFETPSLPKTIGEVLRQGMASDDEGFGQHWRRIVEGRRSGRYPLSNECVRALCDVIDLAPVTASSVRKTFTSRLDLWLNPILDRATSSSDFDLRDLRRKPMSIYVSVRPDDLHRLRPVLALFFEQAIGLQTRVLPEHDPSLKFQALVLLDEVAALGRLPILAEAISYLPGFNVRVALIFHAPSQMREVYGADNAKTMLKSLGARIVFAPSDFEDAKEISDELGFTTVRVRSHSTPRHFGWGGTRGNGSVTVSEQKRPLMLPQELKELGTEHEIVFCEGLRPIRARKIRYWKDPRFQPRLLPPPETPVPPYLRVHAPYPPIQEPAMTVDVPIDHSSASRAESIVSARAATAADLSRLDDLTLADFACDFSRVELPTHDGDWSESEMHTAVNSFLATLEGR